jgi:hypothetical protein
MSLHECLIQLLIIAAPVSVLALIHARRGR